MGWALFLCLLGIMVMLLAAGLSGYITPWDNWDAEGFDERPEVISARRSVRRFFRFGVGVFGVGVIGVIIAAIRMFAFGSGG